MYQEKNVTKSIVSHRIILKQSKQIEYTNEEILQLWNELLGKLDEAGYTYIANADWSALRASTMFSGKFSYQELDCICQCWVNIRITCKTILLLFNF